LPSRQVLPPRRWRWRLRAHAQQFHAQRAEPDTASLTEVQKASLRRLEELLAVVNTGDSAAILSYLEANTVNTPVEEMMTMAASRGSIAATASISCARPLVLKARSWESSATD